MRSQAIGFAAAALLVCTPAAGAAGGETLVITSGDHRVSIVSSSGELVATIPLGRPEILGPCGVAVAGQQAFVISECGGGEVAVIDIPTATVIDTLYVSCCAAGIAATPDGRSIYVLTQHYEFGTFDVFDAATRQNVGAIAAPPGLAARDMAAVVVSMSSPGGADADGCSIVGAPDTPSALRVIGFLWPLVLLAGVGRRNDARLLAAQQRGACGQLSRQRTSLTTKAPPPAACHSHGASEPTPWSRAR